MKNKILPIVFAFATLFAANQASAYYSPSTGRWLSRDPMSEPGFELLRATYATPQIEQVASAASMPPSRLFARDSEDEDHSANAQDNQVNLYNFVNNQPVTDYDLFGLCVALPDPGQGVFTSHIWSHNWNHKNQTGTLTFMACCPSSLGYPNLVNYSLTSTAPPPSSTLHNHIFPNSWSTLSIVPVGPCYKITINVTTTQSIGHWWSFDPFIDHVRITGNCCCGLSSSPPQRIDPAVK